MTIMPNQLPPQLKYHQIVTDNNVLNLRIDYRRDAHADAISSTEVASLAIVARGSLDRASIDGDDVA